MNHAFPMTTGIDRAAGWTVRPGRRAGALVGLVAAALVAAGCSSTRVSGPAPVEDRGFSRSETVAAKPGAENAGKPGYYTVKAGDTVYRIALDNGQNWRDIAAWNNLANPSSIEIGQVLRVVPPAAAAAPAAPVVAAAPVSSGGVVGRPLSETSQPAPAAAPAPAPAAAPAPAPAPAAAATPAGDELTFVWPANGPVVAQFDEATNKGVGIGGRIGDPVVAAADGRVVYAGAGLRGYGNLIILKHNNTYLTAYAHNQSLLVREDQAVKQGQKIAEMGSSDADRVKLHFEVRRLGKPVDPLSHLPKR